MRITLDLPEITIDPTDDGGRDEHGAPNGLPDCPHCRTEYDGQMAKTADGLVHERCLTGWLSRRDERDAWKVLAAQVAKHPSRQSASALRAVIQALLVMQTSAKVQPSAAELRLREGVAEANAAVARTAMQAMKRVYDLCQEHDARTGLIPAHEVLNALGLDADSGVSE